MLQQVRTEKEYQLTGVGGSLIEQVGFDQTWQKKLDSGRQRETAHQSWKSRERYTNALFCGCPKSSPLYLTSSPSSGHFLRKYIRKLHLPLPLFSVGVEGRGEQVVSRQRRSVGVGPLLTPWLLTIRYTFD